MTFCADFGSRFPGVIAITLRNTRCRIENQEIPASVAVSHRGRRGTTSYSLFILFEDNAIAAVTSAAG